MITRRDRLLCAALFLVTTLALQVASRDQGFTRDEGYYFDAAEQHVRYLEESWDGLLAGRPLAFADRRLIDRWLSYNSEHPPLMKTLFGLSWRFLHRCDCPNEAGLHPIAYPRRHRTLGLLKQGQAMRLPAHLLTGALIAGVYLFGALALGRTAGFIGAVLTLLQPRLFFHSQLACFDAPVAAMIFLIVLAYLRFSLQPSVRSGLLFGVVLGLGLLTKHNTFFLPPVLWLHSLWTRRERIAGLKAMSAGERWKAVRDFIFAPWMLYAALVAPAVYFALWPYLWPAPVTRFLGYVGFHLHHVHYNIEYLGRNYNRPPYPWHYVPVMTALTAPVTTLFLFLIGSLSLLGGLFSRPLLQPRPPLYPGVAVLIVLSLVWPMLLIMRPGTPIFGAEKHWLPSMPFLALLSGLGFAVVVAHCRELLFRRAAPRLAAVFAALLALVVATPALLEVYRSHPYGLSHYNALVGGPEGAADLGMNRQFWGYAVRGIFPTLNQTAKRGALIYFHDANWPLLQMSMKDGFLRRDLRDSGLEEPGVRAASLGLVIHEKHFNKYEYWLWDAFETTKPLTVLTHEGVPIVTLYKR
jgi:hypothetical protein